MEPAPKKFLVLAGSVRQYRRWCDENKVNFLTEARYVMRGTEIMWCSPEHYEVRFVGTWADNPQAYEVVRYLKLRGFNVD